MEYFKLGPKANYYYDFTFKISITKGKIMAFQVKPNSQSFKNALKNKHIVVASKEEYNKYKGIVEEVKVPEVKVPEVKVPEVEPTVIPEIHTLDLANMTKAEILEKYAWFDEDDLVLMKSIKTKKALIEFVTETEKLYD